MFLTVVDDENLDLLSTVHLDVVFLVLELMLHLLEQNGEVADGLHVLLYHLEKCLR